MKNFQLVELSRKDYIREDGDYDHVLLNPKWPVRLSQVMRYIERKWGAYGDGMSLSREALMYEVALCSSTTETAQCFECAAARSAMSVSDSAENVPANEDWKEQY